MNSFDTRYMQLKVLNLDAIIAKTKKVTLVAEEMRVSRQSVHLWLIRYRRFGVEGLKTPPPSKRGPAKNKTPDPIEELVVQCANEHWEDGVTTLADELLAEYDITLDPTTIWRILKRRKSRYGDGYAVTHRVGKKKLYAHEVPGQELQLDTTLPYGRGQDKTVYTIIDDATRWVFARTYTTANAENTLHFLTTVLAHAPFVIKKIRHDQGTEFMNHSTSTFLALRGIENRANTPYCPEEDGKIERFHGTLNSKCMRFMRPHWSLDEFNYRLTLFLHKYNYRKKHRGLGMNGLTPMKKLEKCASVNLTLQCHKT